MGAVGQVTVPDDGDRRHARQPRARTRRPISTACHGCKGSDWPGRPHPAVNAPHGLGHVGARVDAVRDRRGPLGHPVPLHQGRGRGHVAGDGRLRADRRRLRLPAALCLVQGRVPRAGRALEDHGLLLGRGDHDAVAADRLRRDARLLRAGRDPDRRRAARRRTAGDPLRPCGARARLAPRRPRGRLRGRRRPARARRRRPARRAARRGGDPAGRGRLRGRADDHQAAASPTSTRSAP